MKKVTIHRLVYTSFCENFIEKENNALEAGIFEKWVEDINEHRERIKKLFED